MYLWMTKRSVRWGAVLPLVLFGTVMGFIGTPYGSYSRDALAVVWSVMDACTAFGLLIVGRHAAGVCY